VEAVLSEQPATITATEGDENTIDGYGTDLDLPEPYSVPLTDYVLYRAFAIDAPQGVSVRSQTHYAAFANALGIKIQVEGSSSPNNRRGAP
jgi:hypothetical protein